MLNKQEIFDKCLGHLRNQGKPAIVNGGCAYRGPNDTRCAIGFLIADEYYRKDLEEANVSSANVQESLRASGYDIDSPEDESFLNSLQCELHDDMYLSDNFLEDLEPAAKGFADTYNLDYKEPANDS